MNKRLDEAVSDIFVKPEKGLDTELFVIENLGLDKKAGNYLKAKYTPKDRFKMMKREYNLAPDNIVKPLALEKIDGKKAYVLENIDGEMLVNSLYRVRGNSKLCTV